MADPALAPRTPLAHVAGPGRHGSLGMEPGVTLREEKDLSLTMLIASRNQVADMRRAAQTLGIGLPTGPTFTTIGDGVVLWSGPEQWLVAAGPSASNQVDTLVRACTGLCMVVDQSDARAVLSISGPKGREVLAKGLGLDLHPRVFDTGSTAVSPMAGIMAQIWQTDHTPAFTFAVPRSFAESAWDWLTEASAEYGYAVID